MIDFTFYSHTYFFKTSEIMLEHARSKKEGGFYYCLVSIVFTAFTIEAFINHCGAHLDSRWNDWDKSKRPKFKDKLKKLDVCLGEHANDIQKVFYIRDYVAHGRPDFVFYETVSPSVKMEELLVTEFEKNITLEKAEYFFEFLKLFMADVSRQSGCNFDEIELFHIFGEGGGVY